MPHSYRALGLATLTAAAVAVAMPAGAQDAKPTPTACSGLTFTDPPGDQNLQVSLLTATGPIKTGHKPPDNTDITAGFFRYAPDASGKNVMTANIQVTNLDNTLEQGSSGATFYFYFDVGDDTRSVSADLDSEGAWTFSYGTLGGDAGPGNNHDGDTTGTIYPGRDGIISIVVPTGAMGIEGKTLASPYASSRVTIREPATGRGVVPTADDGPDNQQGKNFKVAPCAASGTTTQVGGGTTGGGGGGTTTPPGPAVLDLKVTAPKLSAKKLRKSRRFAVALSAGERITALSAKLVKGKKTLGTGKLAAVGPGTGKLTLKLAKKAGKKFRPGTYQLAFSGTKADGRNASGAVSLRVKK